MTLLLQLSLHHEIASEWVDALRIRRGMIRWITILSLLSPLLGGNGTLTRDMLPLNAACHCPSLSASFCSGGIDVIVTFSRSPLQRVLTTPGSLVIQRSLRPVPGWTGSSRRTGVDSVPRNDLPDDLLTGCMPTNLCERRIFWTGLERREPSLMFTGESPPQAEGRIYLVATTVAAGGRA